jgi:hypothetical protein
MPKLVRLALVLPTLAIMAVASATAALADNGVTISVAPTATLTARVEVVTTITVSCPVGWFPMGGAGVTVEEAVGKSIAHGSGYAYGIQCTGANQVVSVTILADPAGPAFKNGTAIATASISAYNYITNMGAYATATTAVRLR